MKLLTKAIREQLPPLHSQENEDDPTVWVRYFCPWNQWTWYGIEYDEKRGLFFGYVEGDFREMGYFPLSELQELCGPAGLRIERDRFFKPQPLSVVKAGRD